MSFDLALGRKFCFQRIPAAFLQIQEGPFHFFAIIRKNLLQHIVGDERFQKPLRIEQHAAVAEFFQFDGDGRDEIAQDAFHRILRNAPYAEETQDVINAKGVEVTSHLLESLAPPCKAVLFHARPIVRGEPPVLALHSEGVGRRAGLHIHVEQFRLLPCVGPMPGHADGNVSLENHSLLMKILRRLLQLQVQMKLDKVIQRNRVIRRRTLVCQFGDRRGIIFAMPGPKRKIGRPKLVPQMAKG